MGHPPITVPPGVSMSSAHNRVLPRLLSGVLTGALVLGGMVALASPAQADEPAGSGSMVGTVTDESGNPVENVVVNAMAVDVPGYEGAGWGVGSDADGKFDISWLPAGTYKVEFDAEMAFSPVLSEWWEDAETQETATVVTVSGGSTTQLDAHLTAASAVAGTVTDASGDPVESVWVGVYRYDADMDFWSWITSGWTAADGTYRISGLPAGEYKIGYQSGWPTDIVQEYWHDAATVDAATAISVDAGETATGIDAQVELGAVTTGTVRNIDGDPVSGVFVEATRVADGAAFVAVTDETGAYALRGMPTGDYTVRFDPHGSPMSLLGEWWDDATDAASASVVSVTGGEVTSGIDAELFPGATMTGTITDIDGVGMPNAWVTVYRSGTSGPVAWTRTGDDGSFEIRGLEGGTYSLRAEASTPEGVTISEWYNNAKDRDSSDPIPVTAGETIDWLSLTLDETDGSVVDTHTAALSGVVTDEDGNPLEGVQVGIVNPSDTAGDGAMTDAAGHWSFEHMSIGSYVVKFTAQIDGQAVTEYWNDSADLAGASVITLGNGEQRNDIGAVLAKPAPLPLDAATPTIAGTVRVGETLTAVPGAWTDGTSFLYQWLVAGEPAPGWNDETFVVSPEDLGSTIAVMVSGSKNGYTPATRTSAETAKVALGVLTAPVPTIEGTVAVGSALTASTGAWTDGTAFTYQWYAGGVAIAGATASTLTLGTAQKDKQISVKVTGALSGYAGISKISALTGKVATAPTPTISGAARVGVTLTAVTGTWTTGSTLAFQWFADGAPIAGATKSTFVPTTAQDSKAITVRVTGAKAGYVTVAKTSSATLKVVRASTPTISGSIGVGSTLTAKPNTWTAGTTFTYQWYANGVAITGATKSTFVPTSSHRDKQLTVKVTGKQTGFTTATTASSATARVTQTAAPAISGVAVVGSPLTAKPGAWTTGMTFSYQWLADGVAISGATKSSFVPTTAQRYKQISVTVTGRKAGYGTMSRTSAKSAKVAVAGTPAVKGTLMVGSTLTASTGTWTTGTSFTYQWYVNGVAISGAKSSTFKLSKGYTGKAMSVRVVGALSGYNTIGKTSAKTSAVRSGKAAPATRDNCPSGYPIKGNQTTQHTTDWIYHVPGGQYYAVTDPEECFATETAAVAWGYRKSLR